MPLGPAAKQVLLPAGTFKTIIKTAGEPGEGCSSRLLFAFSREGAMYRARAGYTGEMSCAECLCACFLCCPRFYW